MMTPRHKQLLAAHQLSGIFVAADDETTDSEIQICRGSTPTGYRVQIGLFGYYYVHYLTDVDGALALTLHGEFRSLTTALKHAAKLAAAKESE